MPAQRGRLALLQLNTTGTTYVAVGGMREPGITINNEPVDVTTADESGVRALLEGAGMTSMSIKASGVYIDSDTAIAALRTAAATNIHKKMRFIIPGSPTKTYEANWMVASFEENGTYNGSVNYSLTLESAGPVTIT